MVKKIKSIYNNVTGPTNMGSVRSRIYSNALLVSSLLALVGFSINVALGLPAIINLVVSAAILLFITLFIIYRVKKKRHTFIFIFSALIMLSVIWFYNGGVSGSVNIVFLLATFLFLAISRKKDHLGIFLLVLTNLIILHIIQYLHPEWITAYDSELTRDLDLSFTYVYILILLYFIYRSVYNTYTEERYKVEVQKTEIELQHKYIKDSIDYASNIQKGFLQDNKHISTMFENYFVFWEPKDIVSGDFYVFNQNNKNPDLVMVAVADCTGHGVPGAMLTMLGISFFNEIVMNTINPEPDEVLNMLRAKFKEALSQGRSRSKNVDGMDMLVCLFDKKNKTIEYAGSNRSLYIVSNGELFEHSADRMPIGVHRNDHKPFSKKMIQLKDNDVVYMTTDGFADQYGERSNKKYFVSKFKRLLVKIHKKPLNTQKEQLKKEFFTWMGNEEQTDDVLVVGIKL